MHQMRPVAQSLSTERLKSGTEFSLLDLLPLRAMRLNTDAKGIFIVKVSASRSEAFMTDDGPTQQFFEAA